jgi:MFS family permease
MKGTPDGRINPKDTVRDTFVKLFQNIKSAFTFKDFWMIAIWKFLTPSQYSSVTSTWGSTYLEQGLGYSSKKAAKYISMTSLGWTVGSPFMSVFSNWVHTRKWTMFVNTVIASAAAFAFFSLKSAPSNGVILTMLFFFALFSGSSLVISAIMFKEMYGKSLVGTMMGCGNFFMLIGTSISQDVTAAILASYKKTEEKTYPLISFRYGLWLLAAICITVSLVFVFFAKDTYKKAMEEESRNNAVSAQPLLSENNEGQN